MWRRWAQGMLWTLAAAGLATAVWFWSPLPPNPSSAELRAAAAGYEAEVLRDRWGVPHVHGVRDADAAFGLAYAHAEDDFDTIQEVAAASRGVLARYRGARAATTDYLVRWMGIWRTLENRYTTDVPAPVQSLAAGYAAGLNLYASEHPEETWPGLAPFLAQDVLAGFMLKTPLFYGLDEELMALQSEDPDEPLALDLSTPGRAFSLGSEARAAMGSNAFAVAPKRASDGSTRLIINSHQPLTGPVAWYEAHLRSDEGIDMLGGIFPGTPVILHGFNRGAGWGNTVNDPDLVDVYALELDPEHPDRYLLDGEWVPFESEEIEIEVRLFGPFALRARRVLRRSAHGPVVDTPRGSFAVSYAGRGELRQLEQYYALNKATSVDEFMRAMALNALPSINYVVADRQGNIALVYNGQFPNRADAPDAWEILPGDRSELIWRGYRGWDAVPKLVNPRSGFVFNANNTPFSATDGPDNLRKADFPRSMGIQRNQTNRSLRVLELTDGETPIDLAGLLAIKFDKRYAQRSEVREVVEEVLAMDWSGDPVLAAAAEHLAAWDFSADAENRQAALGVATVMPVLFENEGSATAPPVADAFRTAVRWLMQHHGSVDVEYGVVNRLVRGELNLPIGGGPDTLRAVYAHRLGEEGQLHMAAGDSWIALVEWDAAGRQSARVIHNFGSATRDASSPHYADQAPLFTQERWREAVLDWDQLREQAERSYRVGASNARTAQPASQR